jgi:site-specific DNA-methyltransferase (adenine-specific)
MNSNASGSTSTTSSRIFNGNCIDVLKTWKAQSVDLVVSDPPYLVNYKDRAGRTIAGDRTSEWLRPAFQEVARVLKNGSYCVCFYGWNQADQFLSAFRAAGLFPVAHFVFQKSYSSSRRYNRAMHECAYLLSKGTPKRQPSILLNSVLPWSYTGNQLHPTEKPTCALTPLIAAFSQPGEVVADPFMGSASTGHAALDLNRHFLGIELDPTYFSIAARRLESRTRKTSTAKAA